MNEETNPTVSQPDTTNLKLTAEDFLRRLDPDKTKAIEINEVLRGLVEKLIVKQLHGMLADFNKDDVSEIVNRTFVIAYTNFSKGKELDFSDPPKSLQSYFWRIADNLCKEFRRNRFRSFNFLPILPKEDQEETFMFAGDNILTTLIVKEERIIVLNCQLKALGRLESEDKEVLVSYYNMEGISPQQRKYQREKLAAQRQITIQQLTVRIHRIRKKILPFYEYCLKENGLKANSSSNTINS
jgi:DNA-directed RNA polymerase specialized sigma24 family protein